MPGIKAGDLAIIKCAPSHELCGRIVEVIERAPDCPFTLPNGVRHLKPRQPNSWIIRLLYGSAKVTFTCGTPRQVTMGVGSDDYLFPLPGDDDLVDVPECVGAHQPEGNPCK